MPKILSPSQFLFIILKFLFTHKKLFAVLLIAGSIALGCSVIHRSKRVPPRTDFSVFIRAAEAVKNGESVYQISNSRSWRYVYFPLLAILLVPFIHLPFLVNVGLWYALSVAAFLGTFHLAARFFPNPREGILAAGAAIIMSLPTFFDTFTRGQLGTFVLFFATAVLYLYLKNKKLWAGFLLAFVITLKFSPVLILGVYFVFKREWRVCFGSALGFLLFLIIFPSFVLGFHQNIALLLEYKDVVLHSVTDTNHKELLWDQLVTPFASDNQSLYADLTRLFWSSDEAMKGHSNAIIHAGVFIFEIISLASLCFLAVKKICAGNLERRILEFSFYPILMLLAAPVGEMHHYTVLFLLFLPAFIRLQDPALKPSEYALLEGGIWLGGLGFFLGYIIKSFRYYGTPVWGILILCAILAMPLFSNKSTVPKL